MGIPERTGGTAGSEQIDAAIRQLVSGAITTYVIGGTRSPSDAHGVYEGNVMIEGVKKRARSTFFPKDWTEKQVESAIAEAYKARKPDREPGIYTGQTASGVEVEMQLTNNGQIHTAYPLYKGPKYKGPAR